MSGFWIISVSFLPVSGMALFPFVLVKNKSLRTDPVLINHERIHLRQQLELLIVPFYLIYILNYVVNLIKYHSHQRAYLNIVFEREAFKNEKDLDYLGRRPAFQWFKYLSAGYRHG